MNVEMVCTWVIMLRSHSRFESCLRLCCACLGNTVLIPIVPASRVHIRLTEDSGYVGIIWVLIV